MKDLSAIPAPTRSDYHQKIAKFYRWMHEHKAKSLSTLTGAAVILPALAEAQSVGTIQINIDDIWSIREYTLLPDGSVRAVLSDGQQVVIAANNVQIAPNGSILIADLAAEELLLASDSTYGSIGLTGELTSGTLAAIPIADSIFFGGQLVEAVVNTISKVIQVVDAPVQGAAVFYDTNNNDAPDAGEFLGVTDENGAVSVTYEPVDGASIIILPLPISDTDSDALFGADADAVEADIVAAYNAQFPDATINDIIEASTTDVITGNVFDLFLSATDDSDLDTQVVSPLSTLVDQGVDETLLKDFLGIDADIDLATFNPYEADLSDGDAASDAAQVAAATVAAANLLETVIAAAATQGGDDGALNKEEELEAAQQAVANLNSVLEALDDQGVDGDDMGGTQAEKVAALTEITTVVATADILDGDTAPAAGDTSLADALVEEIAQQVSGNVGSLGGNATAVIQAATTEVVAVANQAGSTVDTGDIDLADLQETIDEVESVADATATANAEAAQDISDAVDDAANGAANGATLNDDSAFEDVLDTAEDNVTEVINEAVNENLTESALEGDDDFALEFQTTLTKGNVFENDQQIVINGQVETTEPLSSETTIFAVNGTEIGGTLVQSTQTNNLLLSTADWGTPEQTVSAGTLESNLGLANDALPLSTSNAFWSPYAQWWGTDIDDATAGSAIFTTITVAEGDTISFDYIFSAYEYVPYTDYAFVSLVGTAGDAAGSSLVLRNTDAAENPGSQGGPFDVSDLKGDGLYTNAGVLQSSTEQTFTYTFGAGEAGTYTFGIGITDVVDTIFDSMIQVNSVTHNSDDIDLGSFTQLGNVAEDTTVNNNVSAVVATGSYGTLTMNANGDYYYTVGGANADPLPVSEFETDNFTYTIQQDDGTFATSLLTINIIDVGLTATINGDPNAVTDANEANSTISGTVTLPAASTDFLVDDMGEVTITVSDSQGNDVSAGTTSIVGGAFSISGVDLSSLENGALTITLESAYTLQGLDETFAGSDESVENHLIASTATSVKASLDSQNDFSAQLTGPTSVDDDTIEIDISGMDNGTTFVITVSNGTTSQDVTATANSNGQVSIDISSFDLGETLTVTGVLSNGTISQNEDLGTTFRVAVENTTTSDSLNVFASLSEAIAAADSGDTLEMAAGQHSEASAGAITIDKTLTINGAHAGSSAKPATNDALDPDNPRGAGEVETVLGNTLHVSAANVTIDGVRLTTDRPITWNEALEDGLNGFALQNSVVIGYTNSRAPIFKANTDLDPGVYTGDPVTDDWTFSGNLIGGMTQNDLDSTNGGAMFLSGISNLDISDNMFWRPAAAHLYVSSIENATIDGNSFYHGVHAGGVSLDGYDGSVSGYGYGGDGQNPDTPFYGRNFWLEIKGDNENVSITNNSGQYNSGGIQVYGLANGFDIDGLTISGNTFTDFVNADPENFLTEGRSGLMGAINVQLGDAVSATDIVITDNTVTAALDQISTNNNELNLISVTGNNITDGADGGTGSVTITGNTVAWVENSSAEIQALAAVDDPGVVTVSTIKVDGTIADSIDISSNTLTNGDSSQPAIGVFLIGDASGVADAMSSDLTVDNTYSGFGGGASSAIRITGNLSLQDDLSLLNFGGEEPHFTGLTIDGDAQEFGGNFFVGSASANNVTDTAGTNLIYMGGGANSLNLSTGGNDILLLDGTAPGETVDVTGFTTGDISSNANADMLAIFNLGDAGLADLGSSIQFNGGSSAILDDTGLMVFTSDLDFGVDAAGAVATEVDGLGNKVDGDVFFAVASDGAETVLVRVDIGSTNATATEMASFTNDSAADIAGSMANFSLPEF